MPDRQVSISVYCSEAERDWLKHAAALSDISVNEYIKRAVNAQLQQQGVDAVLLRLRDERFDDAEGDA